MGEMLALMGAADICFMGGSLVGDKVGGHNVLEPAALGVPVITGPSYFNFQLIIEKMLQKKCITISHSDLNLDIVRLIEDRKSRNLMTQKAYSIMSDSIGSIDKTVKSLQL